MFAYLLTLLRVAFAYTIPVGVIQAITSQRIRLKVITEVIVGYALPGRPIAMMMLKTWDYTTTQALAFTVGFKHGHYMKVPHHSMLFCQVVATVVAGTVQLGVQLWMLSAIKDICSTSQKDGFICPYAAVFGTASVVVNCCSCWHSVSFTNVITLVGCR